MSSETNTPYAGDWLIAAQTWKLHNCVIEITIYLFLSQWKNSPGYGAETSNLKVRCI